MPTPPRAPPPQVTDITYQTIDFNWSDNLARLREVFTKKEDGRVRVEVQMRQPAKLWEAIYKGYDERCRVSSVEPDSEYQVRMRFGNAHGWGEFCSIPTVVRTAKLPLNGQDIHKYLRLQNENELRRVLNGGQANIEATNDIGFTPLMVAAVSGQVNLCEALLDFDADPNNTTDTGRTALMLCMYKGKNDVAELLMQRGASRELRDRNDSCAIHFAVDGEQYESVKALALAGADLEARDSRGGTPLIRCCTLKNNGNVMVIKQLLKRGALVNAQDNAGQSALFYAVLNQHSKAVTELCAAHADPTLANHAGVQMLEIAESGEYRDIETTLTDAIARWSVRKKLSTNEVAVKGKI